MLSGLKPDFFRSLSVRLSVLYAACCLVSMTAVLIVCYLFLGSSLRRQTDAGLAREIPEYRSLLESQNLSVLQDALTQEVYSEGVDQVFFRILDPAGRVVFSTDTTSWKGLDVDHSALQSALAGRPVFGEFRDDRHNFIARIIFGALSDNMVLQLGESLEDNRTILKQFRQVFAIATVALVLCSLVAGAYMAQRALAGVQRISVAAAKITDGAWEHRVPISRHRDEVDDLAVAFNTMVDRIQALFKELRDVTDDIAHDLRTPLMRIRGEAEMALQESEAADLKSEQSASVLEECDGMLHLINTMLEISQTEAGARPIEADIVDVGIVTDDVCELFRPAAEDKGITFVCAVESDAVVHGEPARLRRALAHLVDNAIKYTPASGEIVVACGAADGNAWISVRDNGIGIPLDAQADIFKRFYRVEASRSKPGNGLGLNLARAIVNAHHGEITLTSDGAQGTEFTITIPLATTAG